MSVRVARDADWPAIREVHRAAFSQGVRRDGDDVVRLIDDLRADPALYVPELSFVSLAGDVVAGHVMNTWNRVGDVPVLQLSPLGVLPEHQRQGHGSALVRAALDAVRARGEPALVLEGNPAYYGRFGFVRADELGLLAPPEALVDWAVQVAVFDNARLPRGQIEYSAPFRTGTVVRRARTTDFDETLAVQRAAFGRDDEAEMVRVTRTGDAYVPELDLVAVRGGRVVGHALTSWFPLEGSERNVLELAPLGVLPEEQGRGTGSELVRASLDAARALGEAVLLLLGDPAYYGRFGFVRASAHGLLPPQGMPDEPFHVAILDDSAEHPQGRVTFPSVFL